MVVQMKLVRSPKCRQCLFLPLRFPNMSYKSKFVGNIHQIINSVTNINISICYLF